jgi:uncharacterized protein (TIGR02145 family)
MMDNRCLDFARHDETTVNNFKKRINMKKNLLLMMMCYPMVLAAQNGVTVSNLAVDAGTVTFNVNWKTPIPVALWSDTVWVFVDYNNAGKMERLPLLPGATLTATSPGGKVIEEPDNNKGVWVAGNARTNSSFSATVKLLTAVKDVGGACVYGSNYPPVGEYNDDVTKITFTGTPKYDLVLEKIADGSTYTISTTGLYSIHAGEVIQSFTDATGAPGIMKNYCTALGATINFTAFNPCSNAAIGATWTLQDTRAGGNSQTYKVKKMHDGHIWMVQDLKFGTCPNSTASWYNDNSEAATTHSPTVYAGYVGHCRSSTYTNAGYLYNWPAAMQNKDAYSGGSYHGCSGTATGTTGTNPGACQGICPVGWHIPTGNSSGEFYDLHNNYGRNCSTSNDNCWNASSTWGGVLGGYCNSSGSLDYQGVSAYYWSSTYISPTGAYLLYFYSGSTGPGMSTNYKYDGFSVRCVKNY